MEEPPQELKTLAKLMYERKQAGENPFILLLGAGASVSSGCSSNRQLIEEIVRDYSNGHNLTWNERIEEFYNILDSNKSNRHVIMERYLAGRGISPGYIYLSELIRDGYFNIIFTTNFDPLLEDAVGYNMKTREFKLIIRGEIDDDRIEEILKFKTPRVKIVKLHGDLNAKIFYIKPRDVSIFPKNFEDVLERYFNGDMIIVGHSLKGSDIANCIRADAEGKIWHVHPDVHSSNNEAIPAIRSHTTISGKYGDFDEFFFNLHYELSKRRLKEFDKALDKKIVKELEREEREDRYIESKVTDSAIQRLAGMINEFSPHLVIVINDPEIPGGPNLWKRIKAHLKDVEKDEIIILGRKGKREVEKPPGKVRREDERQKILVLDAVSLSGKTIELAIEKIREMNPKAEIKIGVLVVSDRLIDMSERGETNFTYDDMMYVRSTSRPEVFLPWAWIQATGNWERSFEAIGNIHNVKWIKRPWGNTEVFAENERCSVKIHTVEAGEYLSLQRHLYRDEFYIPLDESVGVQIEDKTIVIEKGNYILIPRSIWHRFYAYRERGRVLEVAFGWYDQVRDIERREDKYDRLDKDGSV